MTSRRPGRASLPGPSPATAAALVAVVVAVVVAALVVSLVVSLPGPASTAATAAAGGPAVREGAGQQRAGLARFDVVDHNVELKQSAITSALRRAAQTKAPVVLLQEVCWWQARQIREQHPRWTVGYLRGRETATCRRAPSLTALADRDRDDSGVVAVWTGGARGRVSAHVFRHQAARKGPGAGRRSLDDGIVCVAWRATGVVRHACSTHLVNASRYHSRRGTQFRQAREVRRLTRGWVRRGDLVVLGGDFNAAPRSRTMDPLYAVDGSGLFQEATGCPRSLEVCRRALGTTIDGGKIKIDYIFFSGNRISTPSPRRLRVVPTSSDHHLLSGWAFVDVTG
ncbi:endonuclease/exonuclease/phosphatase family protein [Nocardioides rubriscoriae]|uniref:endonuclease/exonuclease/phosphatase family protein n=1 Tax=Nocardioides rubriscoriae TaxID=642762 RepID=UPI0011DFDC50|nr:endonuclease/exonuclease/phosphatase family protein [Nocardioides rubriscoriae]